MRIEKNSLSYESKEFAGSDGKIWKIAVEPELNSNIPIMFLVVFFVVLPFVSFLTVSL